MCERIDLGGGIYGIVCGSRRREKLCAICGDPSTKLCDFPITVKGKTKTCDLPLCNRHASDRGEQTIDGKIDRVNYCPDHERNAEKIFAYRKENGLARDGSEGDLFNSS